MGFPNPDKWIDADKRFCFAAYLLLNCIMKWEGCELFYTTRKPFRHWIGESNKNNDLKEDFLSLYTPEDLTRIQKSQRQRD